MGTLSFFGQLILLNMISASSFRQVSQTHPLYQQETCYPDAPSKTSHHKTERSSLYYINTRVNSKEWGYKQGLEQRFFSFIRSSVFLLIFPSKVVHISDLFQTKDRCWAVAVYQPILWEKIPQCIVMYDNCHWFFD